MTTADKVESLVHQLVGDISRLPGVTLDQGGEQQLAQLITDAFERVGGVALDSLKEDEGPCLADDCGYAEPHFHTPSGYPVPFSYSS